jgi:hypothetical protein
MSFITCHIRLRDDKDASLLPQYFPVLCMVLHQIRPLGSSLSIMRGRNAVAEFPFCHVSFPFRAIVLILVCRLAARVQGVIRDHAHTYRVVHVSGLRRGRPRTRVLLCDYVSLVDIMGLKPKTFHHNTTVQARPWATQYFAKIYSAGEPRWPGAATPI